MASYLALTRTQVAWPVKRRVGRTRPRRGRHATLLTAATPGCATSHGPPQAAHPSRPVLDLCLCHRQRRRQQQRHPHRRQQQRRPRRQRVGSKPGQTPRLSAPHAMALYRPWRLCPRGPHLHHLALGPTQPCPQPRQLCPRRSRPVEATPRPPHSRRRPTPAPTPGDDDQVPRPGVTTSAVIVTVAVVDESSSGAVTAVLVRAVQRTVAAAAAAAVMDAARRHGVETFVDCGTPCSGVSTRATSGPCPPQTVKRSSWKRRGSKPRMVMLPRCSPRTPCCRILPCQRRRRFRSCRRPLV